MAYDIAQPGLEGFEAICTDEHLDCFVVVQIMLQSFAMMADAIIAFVGLGDDDGDGFAFEPAEAGLVEHQRQVKIEMSAKGSRVEAVYFEDVG